jgi:hypothetical protein
MNLQPVDATPPPLPSGTALARHLRRPGDLHDAIEIPEEVRQTFEAKARSAAVPAPLAAALLLELHLLEIDVAAAASTLPEAPEPVVHLRLPAGYSRYLRSITWRRQGFLSFTGTMTALPVRLLLRTSADEFVAASHGDLERALAWEAAAIAAGKSMSEFGLLCALTSEAGD